jgi:hypothetical protein
MEQFTTDDGTTLTLLRRHTRPNEESQRRARAKRFGVAAYTSARACRYHGADIIRTTQDGCCEECLRAGATRSQARR